MKPVLQTVICSTRPGRGGPSVAQWFSDTAAASGLFETELVDIATFQLPVFDEPEHPRLRKYLNEHTKRWSESVQRADAFVFVTPEYNYGPPPSLLNALNYLVLEWSYKPAGFVSYGGIGAGLRGVQVTKLIATALRMVPVLEGIPVPNYRSQLGADGRFIPTEGQSAAAAPLLAELHKLARVLRPLYWRA